jgi:deoxyribonuclease-4
MSIAGGLPLAIDRAVVTGCEAIQIFTKSSSQWRARPLATAEIDRFRQRVDETGIGPNVAHASYLINLASPDVTLRRRSRDALTDELARADALGLAGVVLHPGAYTTSTEADGLARIADGIAEVFDGHPPGSAQLLLEHTAGQGTVLGHRFEHLRTIIDLLKGSMRLGVCLDTCHLVAAGYDLISDEGYTRVFESFERIVGLGRVKAFHLNDSKHPLGSRRDRHEHIGRGYLGMEPFARLLTDDRFTEVPMVLETAKTGGTPPSAIEADARDVENLEALRRLR